MVSGECEERFDDALRVNLDGGRNVFEAARAAGCGVQVGAAMFEGVNERMVRFLLQTDDGGGEPLKGRTSG